LQVCGIFLFVFLNTPFFEILLLPLFFEGSCFTLVFFFSMLLDWSIFFLRLLSIYFF
jgi:hypothetical protein